LLIGEPLISDRRTSSEPVIDDQVANGPVAVQNVRVSPQANVMAPVEQDAASLDAKLPVLSRLVGGDDADEQRVWREPLKSMLDKTLSRAVRSAFAISG
jgi:hypothetical protein